MRHLSPFTMSAILAVSILSGPVTHGQQSEAELVNPNLASATELAALPHYTAELAKATVAARPFLTQAAFDSLLKETLTEEQRTEVYGKAFVKLNLNKASGEEILMIPRLGRRMQHEFEEYRPYRAMAQFRREIGKYVDDAEVERLAKYVFVPINLNSATDEEILAIPGVGRRMLGEFKEYRPYRSIEQFRREIGKYVDDKELSRLERFVTLD